MNENNPEQGLDNQNQTPENQINAVAGNMAESQQPAVNTSINVAESIIANQPQGTQEPCGTKKNKKLPLIIAAASVAGCALIGTGAFAFYRSQPEVVAYDAIVNLINAKNAGVDGKIELTNGEEGTSLTIDLNSIMDAPASSATNLNATMKSSDDKTYRLELGQAMLSDGILYIKVGGIKEAIKQAGADEDLESELGDLLDLIGEIDGQWWKIDIPEILGEATKNEIIDNEDKDSLTKAYGCVVTAANRHDETAKELTKLYGEHKFVAVEKTKKDAAFGNSVYSISLNKDEVVKYTNAAQNTAVSQDLISCLKNAGEFDEESISSTEVTTDDLAVLDELPTIYAQINDWNHKINRIFFDYEKDGDLVKADLNIKYDNKKVEAPSNAKSIVKLMDKAVELYQSYMESEYDYDYEYEDCYDDQDCVVVEYDDDLIYDL